MAPDRMQQQRFEQKYFLSEETALQLRDFVSAHLDLDENSVGKPNFCYPVHSLYLDSDDLQTYWATINGNKNRYKLRLRFYDDNPESPVFFEIKRRMNNCIMKQRGGVLQGHVAWLLRGHIPEASHLLSREPKQLVALQNFCHLLGAIHARPKVHIGYLREAWIHPENNTVRVTMDRHVCALPQPEANFQTRMDNAWLAFGKQVILELKFTNRFPDWFREMVHSFGLVQSSAAKYCEGVEAMGISRLASGPEAALGQGRTIEAGAVLDGRAGGALP
jgi:hypothetical protein